MDRPQRSEYELLDSPGQAGCRKNHKLGYHRDYLRRPLTGDDDIERFLNPYDGRLCSLIVQGSQAVLSGSSKATWLRTDIRNDWRYPHDARNKFENQNEENSYSQHSAAQQDKTFADGKRPKLAEPDYLCFPDDEVVAIQAKVSEWTGDTSYVFVSFFGGQFSSREDNDYLVILDFMRHKMPRLAPTGAQTVVFTASGKGASLKRRLLGKD
ncbi:MAG: hypothetical protein Q9219_006079 [cf. Caloplaca sp. 3 TL-2023]